MNIFFQTLVNLFNPEPAEQTAYAPPPANVSAEMKGDLAAFTHLAALAAGHPACFGEERQTGGHYGRAIHTKSQQPFISAARDADGVLHIFSGMRFIEADGGNAGGDYSITSTYKDFVFGQDGTHLRTVEYSDFSVSYYEVPNPASLSTGRTVKSGRNDLGFLEAQARSLGVDYTAVKSRPANAQAAFTDNVEVGTEMVAGAAAAGVEGGRQAAVANGRLK